MYPTKRKKMSTESSDSNSSDKEKCQPVIKPGEELEKEFELIEETKEVTEPSAQSQTQEVERLSDDQWSKMNRVQRKNYLQQRRVARGGVTGKTPQSTSGLKPEKEGKRKRETLDFTSSPNEQNKRARLDAPQYRQVHKGPKVAITHANYPCGELKEPLIMDLFDTLVTMMREIGPEEDVVHFSGFNIRADTVVINCGDERSKTWLVDMVQKLSPWKETPIRTCDLKELEGFKKIGAFIPNPEAGIESGLANIKGQNRDLDTQQWKILPGGTKTHPKGIYFVASIPESHFKILEKRNFRINLGFHIIEVKPLKKKGAAMKVTSEMKAEETVPADGTVEQESRAGGSADAVTGLDPDVAENGQFLKQEHQGLENRGTLVTGGGQRIGPSEINSDVTNQVIEGDSDSKPLDPQPQQDDQPATG